ncbi:NUDIX domain-containing protein [Nonomuraea sp. NPDC005650]|uniref:NUDIX domain-containing protein n=1 Tax=Nonomuraea sp. NPDC005650 TaxID=3157045 RepID=UPI0033B09217
MRASHPALKRGGSSPGVGLASEAEAEGLSRCPGYYEVAFGGAVDVGESYRAAAARELAEELGVDIPVREVVTFLCQGEIGSYWLGVYEAVIAGDVSPDPKAVSWAGWLTSAELSEAGTPRLGGVRTMVGLPV